MLRILARRLCQRLDTNFTSHVISRPVVTWQVAQQQPGLLIVHPRRFPDHHLQEALRLAATLLGVDSSSSDIAIQTKIAGPSNSQHRPSPATYFGKGTVLDLASTCSDVNPSRVFVNTQLSGVQQRNLEIALGRKVLDRVAVIIEIFAQRAQTKEAKLQVELAQLEYLASRLVRVVDPNTGKRRGFGIEGEVEVVSARERGRSGSGSGGLGGAGGGGESELELQARRIAARRAQLKKQVEEVRKTRNIQRAGRRRSGKPLIALVGYTNAGKSSLLSALSHDSIYVEDKLFSTLDTTARKVQLPSGNQVVVSDTVGFISDLPHQLIDAFHATLEEVLESNLLLHVVDGSSHMAEQQRRAVLKVLKGLGLSEKELNEKVIEVWNKSDLLVDEGKSDDEAREAEKHVGGPPAVVVSAKTRAGLGTLLRVIEERVSSHNYGNNSKMYQY